MKRKIVILLLSAFITTSLTNQISKKTNNYIESDNESINLKEEIKDNKVEAKANTTTITMQDISDFLTNKKEHYPLSDEFIERYQQTSGGYIDYANKKGHLVDKERHEPNQKWHFFDSGLYQSLDDGSITMDADAKRRVYTGLLCPELLLWIYEASGVDPIKVKAAKEVAEKGKVEGTNVSTIAKNMRACVPWEDIQTNIVKSKSVNS